MRPNKNRPRNQHPYRKFVGKSFSKTRDRKNILQQYNKNILRQDNKNILKQHNKNILQQRRKNIFTSSDTRRPVRQRSDTGSQVSGPGPIQHSESGTNQVLIETGGWTPIKQEHKS